MGIYAGDCFRRRYGMPRFLSLMPLYLNNGEVRLRLLVDTLGVEVFVDQGQAHMCMGFLCDYNIDKLKIKALNNSVILKRCRISELKSIWS
jgi:sucrose-6-phosphate hydrolase SacC (GH32 family)